MKAMIFAAGLGTRLRPLTDNKPKALVAVGGIPLLEIAIRRLKQFGCSEILINIHHFGDQIAAFLESRSYFGIRIEISDEREQLLDTGGGLKKASWFFSDEPFVLLNADVMSDLDLGALYQAHLSSGAMATLAVRNRPSSRVFLFGPDGQLCGWANTQTGVEKRVRPTAALQPLAFSGIQVIDPGLFRYFPEEQLVFSIIDTYLLAAAKEKILAFPHDAGVWLDVGKPEQLPKAEALLPYISLSDWP